MSRNISKMADNTVKTADMLDEKVLRILLYDHNKSPSQIAAEYNTYSNKIRRLAKSYNIKLRSRAEASKNALKNGAKTHPTKGKNHSPLAKHRIGKSIINYWETINEEELGRRKELSKVAWEKLDELKKEEMRSKAHSALRVASVEGSKLEQAIANRLREAGFSVTQHTTDMRFGEKLELDILIEDARTVIEIDGPSHFLPIWGEESLDRTMRSDMKKNGLILDGGFVMIRVKCPTHTTSEVKTNELAEKLVLQLNKIVEDFPPPGNRLIEVIHE